MARRAKDQGDQDAGPAPADHGELDLGLDLFVYGQTPGGRFVEIKDGDPRRPAAPDAGAFTEH